MERPGAIEWIAKYDPALLSPSDELLLRVCQYAFLGTNEKRLSELAEGPVDWNALISKADVHHISPLLYRALFPRFAERIPAESRKIIESRFQSNTLQNLLLSAKLASIAELFSSHGISSIPFKGPTLALAAYGDLSLRQSGDLDVLISHSDFAKAKELLLGKGFAPQREMTSAEEQNYLAKTGEFVFEKLDEHCSVDLHSELLPRYFAFQLETILDSNQLLKVSAGDVQFSTLGVEDLLLYLCAHGAKHWWQFLGWICDLAALIKSHPNLNWELIQCKARQLRGERMLLVGLALVELFFELPIPPLFRPEIAADRSLEKLISPVWKTFRLSKHEYLNGWEGFIFHFRIRENWRDKFRYPILEVIFHPTLADRESARQFGIWAILMYPFRIVRLMSKYLRRLFLRP